MTYKATVNERDFKNLLDKMKDVPQVMAQEVQGAGFKAMAQVAAVAARKSSRFVDKTGRLRKLIKVKTTKLKLPGIRKTYRGWGYQVVVGGKGARQGFLVERGHKGKTAQPTEFLETAVTSTSTKQFRAGKSAMARKFRADMRRLAAGKRSYKF